MGGPGQGMDASASFERAFGGHGIEGRWWNNPRIIEKLKLTDDQRKAFDQILLEHREKLIDLHANVEKAELAMEPLVGNDQPNESAILAQIDKLAQARAELEKANARYLLALRSKLTPEQWKQVQAFPQEPRPRRLGPGWASSPGHGTGPARTRWRWTAVARQLQDRKGCWTMRAAPTGSGRCGLHQAHQQ